MSLDTLPNMYGDKQECLFEIKRNGNGKGEGRQLGLPETTDFNGLQKLTIEVSGFNSHFFQFIIEVNGFNSDFGQKTLFFYFFETWYLLIFLIFY